MTDATKVATASAPTVRRFNYMRAFERIAVLLVWVILIAAFGIAMPRSFLNWGNFSIMFASYAPAALLALAIIIPLTAGDYDLSVGATLTLAASTIGVLNVWQDLPILLVLAIVLGIGLVTGTAGALILGRWLTSLSFEISPSDPRILLAAAVLLTGTGLLAAWQPARRASQVPPRIAMQDGY